MEGFKVREIPLRFEGAIAITAVKVCKGKVYLGLTGDDPILIELDPETGQVRDTGFRFPGKGKAIANKIHNSLVKGPDELFYIGHGSNISWARWEFPPEWDGGHLYSLDVETGETEDLGLAVARNTIHALAIGDGLLVGYTIPDNHLFAYDLQAKELTELGNVIGKNSNHNLVCVGRRAFGVYSRDQQRLEERFVVAGNYLFVYDQENKEFQRTEEFVGTADSIDSWVVTSDGKVYGGLSDGVLVELNPETCEVREIGIARPNGGARLSGLAEHEGKVFGTAGWPVMGLFSYEPDTGEFRDYGKVTEEYPQMCYFHGIDILPDGRIYVGETDSNRTHVYELEPLP